MIGIWGADCNSNVIISGIKEDLSMSAWQSIFNQSPVNSGYYDEGKLPQFNWKWPEGTWFQGRLDYTRDRDPLLHLKSRRKFTRKLDLQAA